MGTTSQKLQYLVDAKASIDAALTAKGVTPPTAFGNYGDAIASIPSGGSNKLPQVVNKTVTEITADDLTGATKIGEYAFYDCSSLTSVMIPNGIATIGTCAFKLCTNLQYVKIGDDVTELKNEAFYNCRSLSVLEIGNGLKTIGQTSLYNCPVTELVLPQSFEEFSIYAIYGCSNLATVTIKATTPPVVQASSFASSNPNRIKFYVPAASVEAYKSATNWSAFASHIFAIPA